MNDSSPSDVYQMLSRIVAENADIAAMTFGTVDFAPPIDGRSALGPTDFLAKQQALELREKLRLPFWDGLMVAASTLPENPEGALQAALYHQSLANRMEIVTIENLNLSHLESMSRKAKAENRILVFTSSVQLRDGTIMHLPLLDFHIAYSERATSLITNIIPRLEVGGSLFKSGKSYHFYGEKLLDHGGLIHFLGKALLYSPIVDRAWIAHQLIEGCCALRISPRAEYGGCPSFLLRI